jgi:hypothetical protein
MQEQQRWPAAALEQFKLDFGELDRGARKPRLAGYVIHRVLN